MIYISTGGIEPYGCDGCHLERLTDPETILSTSTRQQTIMEERTLAFGQDVYRHKLAAQELVYAFLRKESSSTNLGLTKRCVQLNNKLEDAWRDGEGDLGRIKEKVTKHFENRNMASHRSIYTPEALIAIRTYIILSTIEAAQMLHEGLTKELDKDLPKDKVFGSWLDILENSRKVFQHEGWGSPWYKPYDRSGSEFLRWRENALDIFEQFKDGVTELLSDYPDHSAEAEARVTNKARQIIILVSEGSWDRFKFVWRRWQYSDGETSNTDDEMQTRLELESMQSDQSNPSLSVLAGEALDFISSGAEYGSSQTHTSVVGTTSQF
jgi:hypothetical protein